MVRVDRGRKAMLVVSAALVGFVLLGGVIGRSLAVEGTYSFLKLFNEVLYLVRNNYVEQVKEDTLMQGAYRGMLEALDPQSEYLSAEAAQRAVKNTRNGPAEIGVVLSKRQKYAVIVSALEGSPAQKAGLGTGDLLLTIDGKSTLWMGAWQATQALQGKPGTEVRLTVLRSTEPRSEEFKVVRKLPLKSPLSTSLPEPGTGLLRLGSVQAGDAERVRKALSTLKSQGAARLLLDLRSNAGSNVDEAVRIAGLLGGEGTVAKLEQKKEGTTELKAPSSPAAYQGSLALLVDAGTAGAAEVLAVALKERNGATLVGEKTWGLGTVQKVITLPTGDGIRLSVGKYVSPSGKEWNGTGISPDVIQQRGSSAGGEDLQLRKGLEILSRENEQHKAA
jgi:carboxyl-terminal processing protease